MIPEPFDVCIIGAGLWGSAAARHLSTDTDLKVCLLGPDEPSKEDYLDAEVLGSHYDKGRITRETDQDPIWGVLAQKSIARYRHLEDITGMHFYSEVGCLTMGPAGSDYLTSTERNCNKYGITVQKCNKQELQNKFPYLKQDSTKEYLFTPNRSGHICPRQLVAAQKMAAHLKGCNIINDTALQIRTILEGSKVSITTRHNGDIHASKVLVCAGAFTNFHKLLPDDLKLDIYPQSEEVVLAEVKGKELARLQKMPVMIMFTGVLPDLNDFYLLPPIEYPNGKFYLKLGHHESLRKRLKTLDDIKRWFASGGDKDIGEYLLKLLHNIIDFNESSVEFKGCVTTGTPTNYPYCGMVSPNIGVLVGGNGYGAKSSDEIGRMGAKLIAKGRWDYDLPEETFTPKFKSGVRRFSQL